MRNKREKSSKAFKKEKKKQTMNGCILIGVVRNKKWMALVPAI
jgi:hypothetical protein